MNIRKYETKDKGALISLWKNAFPDTPPHNAPSIVLEQKLAVDDLIFVAENGKEIVGACIAGYDGHRVGYIQLPSCKINVVRVQVPN